MTIKRIKILGTVVELPATVYQEMRQNGLNWQYCLAGSSRTALGHGCQTFSLYEIHCYLSPPKSWHDNSFSGSVTRFSNLPTALIISGTAGGVGRRSTFLERNCTNPHLGQRLFEITFSEIQVHKDFDNIVYHLIY